MRAYIGLAMFVHLLTWGAGSLYAQFNRIIDIRPIQATVLFDSPTRYYVILAAREASGKSVFGHAFVMWARENHQRQMTEVEAYGYYATAEWPGVMGAAVGTVPGALRDEIAKRSSEEGCCTWSSPDVIGVFRVTRETYRRTQQVRDRWAAQANQYQLGASDCVTFISEIGTTLGISMPGRGPTNSHPTGYLRSVLQSLEGGVYVLESRTSGNRRWYLETNPAQPEAGLRGSVVFRRTGLSYRSSTRRTAMFVDPRPGDMTSRPRTITTESIAGQMRYRSDRFDDGDEFEEIFNPPPASADSRYRFRNGTYARGASFPDRDNAPGTSWANGTYRGDWRRGLPNGSGRWSSANGTYSGRWVDGRPHGRGEFCFPNGDRYVGEFRNGTYHGSGTYHWANGERLEGMFANGGIKTGDRIYPDGRRGSSSGERVHELRDRDRGLAIFYDRNMNKIGEGELGSMSIEGRQWDTGTPAPDN